MDFWRDTLCGPTRIVAPMVDASELAWRLLCRRYGAQLCYTPMLHAAIFCKDSKYRKEALATSDEDKPLIVQFCGNDPKIMLEAALLAEDHCCAIDINLGCPQAIAKRGHYGAFLQDEWPLVEEIVSTLSKSIKIPITCKIRRFDDLERTIKYAKMLEAAGCKMVTLHGRTREQKGPLTGIADWNYVTEVRKALNIPVISNGNIQCMQDLNRCLEITGAAGVMTAEGNLYNPHIFTYNNPPCWEPALEYLDLVDRYPCPSSYVRGHLFKLFHHLLSLPENARLRVELGAANTLGQFRELTSKLGDKYRPYHEGKQTWNGPDEGDCNLSMPPWLCQCYIRMAPEEHLKLVEVKQNDNCEQPNKRKYTDPDGNPISRKQMKKLRRMGRRPDRPDIVYKKSLDKCSTCVNPLGAKCQNRLCKKCCKDKCFVENLDCPGHRILVKTRREMAQFYQNQNKQKC